MRRESNKRRNSNRKNTGLALEPLEVRRLLAGIVVNTTLDDAIPDDGLTTLREAITLANSDATPDTISFELGAGAHTINLTGALPAITAEVEIQGPGQDLLTVRRDTGGDYRIFESHATATLSGMTISNGAAVGIAPHSNGGGVSSTGALTVNECTFTDNSAVQAGGAILSIGNLAVRASTFHNNSGEAGGAIGQGAERTLEIVDSTFTGNSGGAVYTQSPTEVTGTVFTANAFAGVGGAIHADYGASLSVQGSTFNANVAFLAGAIRSLDNLSVSESAFSNNVATGGGGGAIEAGNTVTTISDCTFTGNAANFDGGAVSISSGDGRIVNTVFTGNTAFAGGAVLSGGILAIDSCTFEGNAASTGGAIHHELGLLTVSNSTITGNNATGPGGGIYIRDEFDLTQTTIAQCTISGNTGIRGGGIYVEGVFSIASSVINDNAAYNGSGGGIFSAAGTGTITDCTISGNTCVGMGAGINAPGVPGELTIENTTLTGNIAGGGGGAIRNSVIMTIRGSVIDGNSAGNVGGGIYNSNIGTLTVENTTISGNSTDFTGGGISSDGSMTVVDSTISENTVTGQGGNGGGIFGSGTVSNSTIKGNVASAHGGGISGGGFVLEGSTVTENSAVFSGGGIFSESSFTIRSSTITENSAGSDDYYGAGGGISFGGGTATIEGSVISSNYARGSGGGILNSGGELMTLLDTVVSDNVAATFGGGGIYALGSMTLHGCDVSGNTSYSLGGGIYHSAESLVISDSVVSRNAATAGAGGAVHIDGTTSILIERSTISDNVAGGNTGGILNTGGGLTIRDSTVSGNRGVFGGGLFHGGPLLTMSNCTFTGNSATGSDEVDGNGGAIYLFLANGQPEATITHSTISGNSAAGNAGGIYVEGSASLPVIKNTIVASNTAPTAPDISGAFAGAHNFIGGNPMLAPLADNGGPTLTMRLLPGSPCFNTGSPLFTPPPATDQRGFNRVVGPAIDIGAYEGQVKELFNDLIYRVGQAGQHGTINAGQANSMANPLDKALAQFNSGNTTQAIEQLGKFIGQLDARIKALKPKDANYSLKLAELLALKTEAQSIVQELVG